MSDTIHTFQLDLDLGDLIECGTIDAFNDLVEEALLSAGQITQGQILEDIAYEVVGRGHTVDEVRILVSSRLYDLADGDTEEADET
jgi:hypothetical protein